MKYNPDIHHRRSIRLIDFDYSSEGAYFITICTENRIDLFGEIIVEAGLVSARMELNDAGKMIELMWHQSIPKFYIRKICNYAESFSWDYNYTKQ